ncbi:unnamed protein product, partial [Vitis vinifera]
MMDVTKHPTEDTKPLSSLSLPTLFCNSASLLLLLRLDQDSSHLKIQFFPYHTDIIDIHDRQRCERQIVSLKSIWNQRSNSHHFNLIHSS